MRKPISAGALLVIAGTTSVLAADLPSTKGAPVYAPPPPALSWTGVYVGGQVGIQWGQTSWDRFDPTNTTEISSELPYTNNGVVGGGHVGYNYQVSQFVFGLEGDVEGTNYHGNGASNDNTLLNTTRTNVEASIRARAGIAWNELLFYLTGGGTYANFHNNVQESTRAPFLRVTALAASAGPGAVVSNLRSILIGRFGSRTGFRNTVTMIFSLAQKLSIRVCGIIGSRRVSAISSICFHRPRQSSRNTKPAGPASGRSEKLLVSVDPTLEIESRCRQNNAAQPVLG